MMIRPGQWRSLRALIVALLLPACSTCANELTVSEEQKIERWLNCEECVDGEREAVRAIGQRAIPALARALKGPPSEHVDNMRSKFRSVYTGMRAAASAPDSNILPRVAYVERGVANYVATYQTRAALSLSDIGGPEATSELQAATTQAGYRADVVEAIRVALSMADPARRFRGSITPRTPAFGDTVIVRPAASQPFDGDELAHIQGSTVSPSDTRLFSDSNRFGFVAVGFPGPRLLTVRNVATTADTQYATIAVSTLADANDRGMRQCPDPACRLNRAPGFSSVPSAVSMFFTLWRTASSGDTVDLVTFRPSAPLHVTASLTWSDTTKNLDLRWMTCSPMSATGNTNGATTTDHPERTTVDIPGGQCWVLLVLLNSPAPVPPVIAHLRVTP